MDFAHLHVHTQYSLLDGAANIKNLMQKAKHHDMKAVALTDHGNMFGAFKFVAEANKQGIKPIVGCEFYLVENRHEKTFTKQKRDKRFHQLLLAKNTTGYENLSKLCSLGFIEGLYSKFPRIDKELIIKYHEGLIATSCCIGAEIPQAILKGDEKKAEELLKWWLDIFQDDFYIELQRHRGLDDIDGSGISQEYINQVLIKFAEKYNVKTIATNDSHYVEEEDSAPHDILLCVNTGSLLEEEKRFRFPSSDFYFKSKDEMATLFQDVPEAVDNTIEIVDKIDNLQLARDVLLPNFPLPQGFQQGIEGQNQYLKHLTFQGAQMRYGTITPEIEERINFELETIRKSGYPGYFLIVQDFTTVARQMGVAVGPGRGSAAGSVVAYCTGITNVDPIKYDLLFERFLNPERISMPDIDIDFDDEGRSKIIDYVIDKYGRNQVAQIITYGSMAAKSSLRDVGRVMNVPLQEVDKVAKSFPTHLSATLKKVLEKEGINEKLRKKMNSEDIEQSDKFRTLAATDDQIGQMIRTAERLEGSVRNTGIHACGVVITPDDITKFVPVTVAKDSELLVSQFDNSVAEDAGLLKMDFLGLRTLTIIKDAVKMVEENYGVKIDVDAISLEDELTYELFQRGETVGVFQYESAGMQKYMKELKPDTFLDLIAMNALYRPGPLQYIPKFIARRHGKEEISYDLDAMEELLAETYGITVYQEQVMLLSQKLANFSKGQADMLRKAMGKKKKSLIDELYPLFVEGCVANGHDPEKVDKIWKDWEAFAAYAFNKSHSTCYALIAFQTAYLKAHYPAEYMASVLTHNRNDISKVRFFLRECKRMKLDVLGPDINESQAKFAVNKKGQVRFALAAIKGVGSSAVENIVEERKENGLYKDLFDLTKRVNLRSVNKKPLESLVHGGAFDCWKETHRAQYFSNYHNEKFNAIEKAISFGGQFQNDKLQNTNSLFGAMEMPEVKNPEMPETEEWGLMHKLSLEKEVTGIYLSGHPLDDFEFEMKNFCKIGLEDIERYRGRDVNVGGIVTESNYRMSKRGTEFGIFKLSDYHGEIEFRLFKEPCQKFKHLLQQGRAVYIRGKYVPSWMDENVYELKINSVELLEEIGEKLAKKITFRLEINKIDKNTVEEMVILLENFPGKKSFFIEIIDREEKIKIGLKARTNKISINNELIDYLKQNNIKYSLN